MCHRQVFLGVPLLVQTRTCFQHKPNNVSWSPVLFFRTLERLPAPFLGDILKWENLHKSNSLSNGKGDSFGLVCNLNFARAKDVLHNLHQGVACVLIPTLICDHLEHKHPGLTLDQLDAVVSHAVFKHYQNWCRSKGQLVSACSHRFSALRFGKKTWSSCPELVSIYKAATVKTMMTWCAVYLREEMAMAPNGDLRAFCMHSFAMFQQQMDICGPFFSTEEAKQAVYYGRTGLLLYQKLAGHDSRRTDGRQNYKIIPKFHSVLEHCLYIQATLRNPRWPCSLSRFCFQGGPLRIFKYFPALLV